MITFESILRFAEWVKVCRELIGNVIVTLIGTVKLHGQCAMITYDGESYQYQSRNEVLTSGLNGFVSWAKAHEVRIAFLFNRIIQHYQIDTSVNKVTLIGEWCGEGIQEGVALSELPKAFVLFAIKVNGVYLDIHNFKDDEIRLFNIRDYGLYLLNVDLANPEASEARIAELVNSVEAKCPYAFAHGVTGVGEGIVWKTMTEHEIIATGEAVPTILPMLKTKELSMMCLSCLRIVLK